MNVSLFANAPDIVTPIGATVDSHGRLLVIESNTHFRQKNYQGPAVDRIIALTDTKGDGKAQHINTFYEGGTYLMNLSVDKDGSVVVSSRNEIFRLVEGAAKNATPQKITIAHLETTANYPHNGLHGLTIAKTGDIYFSIGENLGGPYALIGSDGQKLSDDKGSGSIFRVDSQGHGLTRIAHGFWNPFGLGFDTIGNLFAVDNDPDGRPPSRLIHVVPGGDYGFEFRYGRTGLHPLQAWDGELPGTLGMVSGVGEAPCAVVWQRGRLFVSSWRDHQIQMYTLTPHGATYTASMELLVTGPESFRPTGIAFAPDGSLFVNDWGSASYSVNGKGCVWKLTFTRNTPAVIEVKPSDAMMRAEHLRQSDNVAELTAALDDADPSIAQAAQYGLSKLLLAERVDLKSLATPRQRIGLLAAIMCRGSSAELQAGLALKDEDDRVRQMAVRAISEQDIQSARPALTELLNSQVLSPRLLGMTVAVLNQLDGDKSARIDSKKIDGVLLARINAPDATDQTKAMALHMLQNSHPQIDLDALSKMTLSTYLPLQLEAVRYISSDTSAGRFKMLEQIIVGQKAPAEVVAEAIDGLSDDAKQHIDLLLAGAGNDPSSRRQESLRTLKSAVPAMTKMQLDQLAEVASKFPADADLVRRIMGQPLPARPPETDIAAWQKILEQAPGDPDAGRRIFFHPAAAGCYHCHMIEGRGRSIGPDLSMIGHSQTREHVLESILDPSKEIAPLFTLWSIKTRSGQQIDGMLLRRDGQEREVWVDSSGQETKVDEKDVIDRQMRKESLMPAGLVAGLTNQELRDLVAFLMEKR